MDVFFYEYGVKPLEKEFENYDKKVATLLKSKGFDYATGFLVWQLFKFRKLFERLHERDIKEFSKSKEENNG